MRHDPAGLEVAEMVGPVTEYFMDDVGSFPWGGELVLPRRLLEAEDEVANVELTSPNALPFILAQLLQ